MALACERLVAGNRLIEGEFPALKVADVLDFATVEGARACGLGECGGRTGFAANELFHRLPDEFGFGALRLARERGQLGLQFIRQVDGSLAHVT